METLMWNDVRAPNDDFIRGFVLLLLGTFLAPMSPERIQITYYSMVQDISGIKDINWNAFTLGFLKENLATLNEGTHSTCWPFGKS